MPLLNQTEEILHRHFEMRVDDVIEDGHGGGSGIACMMGVLDEYRSVWSPRAFAKPVLAQFVQAGFISDGHDWQKDLATIRGAKVTRNELRIEWDYYSIVPAQEMRTKVKERKDRDKMVGLSIGAFPNWSKCADFDSGEKLWTYAEGLDEDMSLYDPSIRKHKGYCWIIPEVRILRETAITLAQAVPGSEVSEARHTNDLLRSEALGALPFGEHLSRVLGAVEEVEARGLEIEALRADSTGRIGRDNLTRILALRDSLTSLIDRSTQPQPQDDIARRMTDINTRRRLAALGLG